MPGEGLTGYCARPYQINPCRSYTAYYGKEKSWLMANQPGLKPGFNKMP